MATRRSTDRCREALVLQLRPDLFRALGDGTRLQLLVRLAVAGRPQTVTEASTCCGIHLSGVSRQLAILRDAGVLRAEKRGREVRYRLDSAELIAALRGLADAIEACERIGRGTRGTR